MRLLQEGWSMGEITELAQPPCTCPPRYTQIVPKWHLGGQLAGTGFFTTRAPCNAQKFFKNVSVCVGGEFGWICLLKNGGKGTLETMRQPGVFPAIYPNSAKHKWTCDTRTTYTVVADLS